MIRNWNRSSLLKKKKHFGTPINGARAHKCGKSGIIRDQVLDSRVPTVAANQLSNPILSIEITFK